MKSSWCARALAGNSREAGRISPLAQRIAVPLSSRIPFRGEGPAAAALFLYKNLLSPFLRALGLQSQCKFHPTCSEYVAQAIAAHGVLRGTLLAGHRLARCHPFSSGGLDPVPITSETKRQAHS